MNKQKKYESITTTDQINYLSKLPLSALFSMWISLKLKPLRLKCKPLLNNLKKQNTQPTKPQYCLIIVKNDNCSFLA